MFFDWCHCSSGICFSEPHSKQHYCQEVLQHLWERHSKRLELWRNQAWLLPRQCISQSGTMALVTHPPYLIDVALCDLFLFLSVYLQQWGCHFWDFYEIQEQLLVLCIQFSVIYSIAACRGKNAGPFAETLKGTVMTRSKVKHVFSYWRPRSFGCMLIRCLGGCNLLYSCSRADCMNGGNIHLMLKCCVA
jgi:hypothetical protein